MVTRFQCIGFDPDQLPTMPLVAAQIIELIHTADTSANDLAKIVAKDPAVAAKVLKIANSSFYSMSRQVTTLSTAIVILGERTLKNLVLAASMRGMHQAFGHLERMLWEDSMVCALGSRFLARKLLLADPEEAFMAGLFRHVGKVVLAHQDDGARQMVAEMLKSGCHELVEREKELFGTTHAELGAAVLEHWRLNEALSLVALHHCDADLTGIDDQNTRNLISLVNIANLFPNLFGVLGEVQGDDLAAFPGAQALNLDNEKIEELVEEFRGIFEENREEFLS